MERPSQHGLSRRQLLRLGFTATAASLVPGGTGALFPSEAQAQNQEPLPSWNDGIVKQSILNFVRVTTDPSNPKFVPSEERVATFDQDGTLWVEHPMYSQVVYCFDLVPAVVKSKPELANVEPFKTVLSDNREAIERLPMDDLLKILAATCP